MSANDLVLILLAVVCLAATVALTLAVLSLRRQVSRLEQLVGSLDDRAVPAAARLEAAAVDAATQVRRVEDLLDAAAAFSATTEAAGRVLATPVIKSAAIAAGTQRAARRLRGQVEEPQPAPVPLPTASRRIRRRKEGA